MSNDKQTPETNSTDYAPDTALAHLNKPAHQPKIDGPTEEELLEQTGDTPLSKLNKPSGAPNH
jgi:hypothetical protein